MVRHQNRKLGLVRVIFPLTESGSPRLSFELTPKEFFALGEASVQWAYLEHLVMQTTLAVSASIGINPPAGAMQDSFRRRLAAFRHAVTAIPSKDERTAFLALADKIANANTFRQKLAHGVWSYDTADAEILHVEVSRKEGNSDEYFNVERIFRFAEDVGTISFQLQYPGGKDQFLTEKAEAGHGMSREFLKMLQGKPSLLDDLARSASETASKT